MKEDKVDRLYLEVTSHCNMHCSFCPSDDILRTKQHITEEHALKFIQSAPEMGTHLLLNVLGEPLLNKKVFDYIGLCEKLNFPVHLVTNITLLDEERLRKLFSYSNLTIRLSLHTPTENSFLTRGDDKIPSVSQYLGILFNALEAKFRYHSHACVEIHIATELADGSIQSDTGRLWTLFSGDQEFETGWNLCTEKLSKLAEEIRQKHPVEYQEEVQRASVQHQGRIEAREIVFKPSDLAAPTPGDFDMERFWWMAMPNVFVHFKAFSLWGRHEPLLKKHAAPGTFLFNEERKEPFICPAPLHNFAVLSNGEYTLCCQDVEGEMQIGNIRDMEPKAALQSARRREIIENSATSKVCRVCMGHTFILETKPLAAHLQTIDKFGFGFHAPEADLFGRPGCWTDGNAKAYFYNRLDASEIRVDFYSPHRSETKFRLVLSQFDPVRKCFVTELSHDFSGEQAKYSSLLLPVRLKPLSFYRLSLLSPSFIPASQSKDARPLGITIASMELRGQPLTDISHPLSGPEARSKSALPLAQPGPKLDGSKRMGR